MRESSVFFNDGEQERLDQMCRQVDPGSAAIAYCVFENPFARGGGIYAVADNYSRALKKAGDRVVVLSPFHSKLQSAPSHPLPRIGACEVPFGSDCVTVTLFEYLRDDVRWVLFGADGYFDATGGEGRADPYVYDYSEKLLTDSLFASAAIPYALAALGMDENVIVHVQDWELAACSLTVKLALVEGRLRSAAVILTSHNPYDRELPHGSLSLLTSRHFGYDRPMDTVYQCFAPLFDAPITTVSETFAKDLTSDPLQKEYFAGHLQSVYADCGVIGVDNGLFLPSREPFSRNAVRDARKGHPDAIIAEKTELRRKMLAELDEYRDDRIYGYLSGHDGGSLRELPDDVAVFLMFGRLDPGQKGFDVLSQAIQSMPPGRCRFVLTPIVARTTAYSEDLRQLAERRPGEVVVYPFRMERGYMETMAGATFAVFPSLYEPFGAATEPYLMGTPVIGRATGGLCQQVVDFYSDTDNATGFLFREVPPDGSSIAHDWRVIQHAATPAERFSAPLYGMMVASLAASLAGAAEWYRYDKAAYGRMLANLSAKAETFGWEKARAEYQKVYRLAVE